MLITVLVERCVCHGFNPRKNTHVDEKKVKVKVSMRNYKM